MTNVKLLLSAAYLLCQTRYGLAAPALEESEFVRVPGEAFNRIHGYNSTDNKRRSFTTVSVWSNGSETPHTCTRPFASVGTPALSPGANCGALDF